MVFCIRKLNWMKAAPKTKIFRNYAKYDPAKFCEDLRGVNWVVNIDGKELTRVAECNYLGVILDESLSWNAHVNYLISKVSKRLGILGRTRGSISMHTAGIIYRSFILPVLDYCDTVWNYYGRINADNIEKLQRRAARIIM